MSRRRKRAKHGISTILIILILLFAYNLYSKYYGPPTNHVETSQPASAPDDVVKAETTPCRVVSVTDGDTFKCELSGGKEESIRLIGIDTPESRRNSKAKRDSEETGQDLDTIVTLGKKSAQFTKSQLQPGTQIKLELDVQPKDQYGRTLAYAYLPDGTMLNALLVKEGYAIVSTYPPNVKYQDLFLKLQTEARENHRGLWKE